MAYENEVKHSIKAIQSLITNDGKDALRALLLEVAHLAWIGDAEFDSWEQIVDRVMKGE